MASEDDRSVTVSLTQGDDNQGDNYNDDRSIPNKRSKCCDNVFLFKKMLIALVMLVISLVMYYFILFVIEPTWEIKKRGFFFGDPKLSNVKEPSPFYHEMLLLFVYVVPLGIFLLYEILGGLFRSKCPPRCNCKAVFKRFVMLCYHYFNYGFVSLLGFLLVVLTKFYIGTHRPFFLLACNVTLLNNVTAAKFGDWIGPDDYNCTGFMNSTIKEWNKANNSFFSGHTNSMWIMAIYMILWIALNPRFRCRFLEIMISSGLLILATVVSVNRIYTNHHHLEDVLAGFVFAVFEAIILFMAINYKIN